MQVESRIRRVVGDALPDRWLADLRRPAVMLGFTFRTQDDCIRNPAFSNSSRVIVY